MCVPPFKGDDEHFSFPAPLSWGGVFFFWLRERFTGFLQLLVDGRSPLRQFAARR